MSTSAPSDPVADTQNTNHAVGRVGLTGAPSLVGREAETRAAVGLVAGLRERGGALIFTGEPGIGKSAMLEAAVARAETLEILVLQARGVQSEARLAFAGLQQLVHPLLGRIHELPAPQREAIGAALGIAEAASPDLFLIGLATLNLVANAAAERGALLVVDDAQWLDPSSTDVLTFIARRLESEPVALMASARDGFETPLRLAGLPEHPIARLDEGAASALLDAGAPWLEAAARVRVLEEAAGNPLGLVELPRGLPSGSENGSTAHRDPLPLTQRLERSFASRASDLDPETRALLLAAAVNDTDSVSEALSAASVLSGTRVVLGDLCPAVDARLVDIDNSCLRFRHTLMRSAVRQAASVSEVRAAHAALASVLTGQPDRKVWHLAASTTGVNETVAAELDAAATRAQRRGSVATAAAALERAAQLSGDENALALRLLRSGEFAFQLGRHGDVSRLLKAAEPVARGPEDLGRIALIREMTDAGRPRDAARLRATVASAEELFALGHPRLALNLFWAAASSCYWTDPGIQTREIVISAVKRMQLDDGDPWRLVLLAAAAPIECGAAVARELVRPRDGQDGHLGLMRQLGNAAICIGAYDIAQPFLEAASLRFRAQGRAGLLAQTLSLQAAAEAAAGTLSNGTAAADEAVRLTRETVQPLYLANSLITRAQLAALRGDEASALADSNEAEQIALPFGASWLLSLIQLARGLAALATRRYDEAYAHLRRIFDAGDPAHHPVAMRRAIGSLTEAAVHTGRRLEASGFLVQVEPIAEDAPSSLFQLSLRHARALLADDAELDEVFADVRQDEVARWPFELARLRLAHGERLRRSRRSSESRASLRSARDAFDALGAQPWGERARQELRASGETSRRRTAEARDELTPQELQIAQLAASGLTNREIGQMLYLSHRTISSHLYRTFPKLGITSRAELRDSLTLEPR
jgi:DNA-binding CsgD family transcriptional regulator/tetratricopeptide (TPR) repeat protein